MSGKHFYNKSCRFFLYIFFLAVFFSFVRNFPAAAITTRLRVAYNPFMPPFQFTDENGMATGMHVDILNAIARENQLVLEYIPMEKDTDCKNALDTGKADLALGILIDSRHPEQFTDEISASSLCLIVSSDLIENQDIKIALAKKNAAFEYGTSSYSLMSNIGAAQYTALGSQQEIFQNHLDGHADAIIGVKDCILYQIYSQGLENKYTIANNYMSVIRYGIMTQREDIALRRTLNSGLMSLRASGEYDKIHQKWTIDEPAQNLKLFMERLAIATVVVSFLCLGYVIFNQRIKYLLKKQVPQKTMEIQEANLELERRILQIQNANNLQRRLIENSPGGMIYFDRSWHIRIINTAARSLAGGVSVCEGMSIMEIPLFSQLLTRLGMTFPVPEAAPIRKVIRMNGEDGGGRTFQCSVQPTGTGGEMDGAILSVSDITKEEQETQAAFEKEKSKALNRIVAGIAHEIKNPLMSIRTFATLFQTRKGDLQVQEMFAEYVPGEVDRINKLIESLINYAKPSQREITVIPLSQVVDESIYLAKAAVKRGSILLEVQTEESLFVLGDQNQLKQVLINILINGIESMEEKLHQNPQLSGTLVLRIQAKADGDFAVITILDQGRGMSEKEIRRCTDPFFTTKSNGTGLGLALSKSYIEENGGSLFIESKEQEYTRITIRFRQYQKDKRKEATNEALSLDH